MNSAACFSGRCFASLASCRSRCEKPPKAKHIQTKKCPFLEASCSRGEHGLVLRPPSGLTALVLLNYNALCCGHKMLISPYACSDALTVTHARTHARTTSSFVVKSHAIGAAHGFKRKCTRLRECSCPNNSGASSRTQLRVCPLSLSFFEDKRGFRRQPRLAQWRMDNSTALSQ